MIAKRKQPITKIYFGGSVNEKNFIEIKIHTQLTAAQKQIPQEVSPLLSDDGLRWKCPVCGKLVDDDAHYCKYCGQAICDD